MTTRRLRGSGDCRFARKSGPSICGEILWAVMGRGSKELHKTTCRTTVIKQVQFFLYYCEKVSHLKILLPCFSSVTHTMWWLAPNFSDGAEFEFAAPSFRPFAWRCYWTGRIYPPLHLPPWPGWMIDGVELWWPGAGWLMGYWSVGGWLRFRCRGGAISAGAGKDPGVLRMMARVTSSITVETCWERDV